MPIRDIIKRRESKKIYERLHKEAARARGKKYRESNPDRYREMCRNRTKEYRMRNPTKNSIAVSDSSRKKLYGIDGHRYRQMLSSQNNLCAICGREEENKRFSLAVDHCHKSGKIRGLLCSKCNPGLGMFRDSVGLLEMAIKYLQSNAITTEEVSRPIRPDVRSDPPLQVVQQNEEAQGEVARAPDGL